MTSEIRAISGAALPLDPASLEAPSLANAGELNAKAVKPLRRDSAFPGVPREGSRRQPREQIPQRIAALPVTFTGDVNLAILPEEFHSVAARGNKPAPAVAGAGGISEARKKEIVTWINDRGELAHRKFPGDAKGASHQAIGSLGMLLRGVDTSLRALSDADRSYLAHAAPLAWIASLGIHRRDMARLLSDASAKHMKEYIDHGDDLALTTAASLAWAAAKVAGRDPAALRGLVSDKSLNKIAAAGFLGRALASEPNAGRELDRMLIAIGQGRWDRARAEFVKQVYLEARGPVWDNVAPHMPAALAFALSPHASRKHRVLEALRIKEKFKTAGDLRSLTSAGRQSLLNELLDVPKLPWQIEI
jgi:hypothetical protein